MYYQSKKKITLFAGYFEKVIDTIFIRLKITHDHDKQVCQTSFSIKNFNIMESDFEVQ